MILSVDQWNINGKVLSEVTTALNRDGIIIYPTDTVYGIGCRIDSPKALRKLYDVKRSRPDKPFSFICSSLKEASKYAVIDNESYKIMKELTPGPFTFVLPARKETPKLLRSSSGTVGIRIPDHIWPRKIVEEIGAPIVTTSVKIENFLNSYDMASIVNYYQFLVDVILEEEYVDYIDYDDITQSYSTVVRLINGELEVLREGKGKINL